MTWMELRLLLNNMADTKHTALTDTPQQKVCFIGGDGELYYADLVESMSHGSLVFIADMLGDSDGE